ncbi:hypothetical protein [Aurantiacibacter spongiae]|uniref:Uncharacterized protein n=1 Tax=Aurantiacibacter spongiae TaxID=2488860 RepID=A0A3N5DFQ7_9SPHN|nr:hypothetical protein [Aurantiacibacter spongiae]RPF70482.1 hypothetical protein EG799_01685 [Aurantiacibacter spongiae]
MAQISKPPIPLKMYKHFAVTTVAMTGMLAMFADGENRQAMEAHVEQHQEDVRIRKASAEITGPPRLALAEPEPVGSFGGTEGGGDFGAPMIDVSPSGSSIGRADYARAAGSMPGYSQDFLDTLSEEELASLLADMRRAGLTDAGDIRRAARMMERSSARRSGSR